MEHTPDKQFIVKTVYGNGFVNANCPWFATYAEAEAYVNKWRNSTRHYVIFRVMPVLDTRDLPEKE